MPRSFRDQSYPVKVKQEKLSPQRHPVSKSSSKRHSSSSSQSQSDSDTSRTGRSKRRGPSSTVHASSSKRAVPATSRSNRRRSDSDSSASPVVSRRLDRPSRRSSTGSTSDKPTSNESVSPIRTGPRYRSGSPVKRRSTYETSRRDKSGSPVKRRSPNRTGRRQRSDSPVERRSPPRNGRRNRSGSPVKRHSPHRTGRRDKSESPLHRRSPQRTSRRNRSGSPIERRPKTGHGRRQRSGSPAERRRNRSGSPVERRSGRRDRSESPVKRRTDRTPPRTDRHNRSGSPPPRGRDRGRDRMEPTRRHSPERVPSSGSSSNSEDERRQNDHVRSTTKRDDHGRTSSHPSSKFRPPVRSSRQSDNESSENSESDSSAQRRKSRGRRRDDPSPSSPSSEDSDSEIDTRRSDSRRIVGSSQDSRTRNRSDDKSKSGSPASSLSTADSSSSSSSEEDDKKVDRRADRAKDKKKSKSKTKKNKNRGGRISPGAMTAAEVAKSEREGWILGSLKQLHEEKVAKRGTRQKEKEILKLMETPEEKRLRRLLKKEAKERKRKERMGWDKDYMHYTNTDNPFGDANLLETFVWQKKLERDGITDVSTEILEQRSKMKQEENKYELEKVKKRRLEREQERAQRDEEMTRMQSQKEAAQFMEWEKQEDTFHLQQALLRSKIRIEDGRAKPIDLLAKYISTEDEDLAVEMHEPYTYLNGLTIRDLEDLLEDIKVYMELEKGKNLDYWNDITIIVDDELYKLRKVDAANREHFGDRREGIHVSVNSEVNSVFKAKTHSQLAALHNQIIKKITGGEEGIDIGYWESLLSQLKAQMARARLRDRHQENLRRKLFQLKQEQGVESEPTFPITEDSDTPPSTAAEISTTRVVSPSRSVSPKAGTSKAQTDAKFIAPPEIVDDNEDSNQQNDFDTILTEEDLREHSMEEYVAGCYSPKLTRLESLEPGTLLIDPYDDAKCLDYARNQLIGTGRLHSELTPEERAFEMEARTGMNDDEAMFSVETPLDHKMYLWSDKYRPRKPRYFNRVHTGFEWNKYNQTHYDMDNPPPKIVQGYKFNIFYPDLIDKSITPEYTLTPCPDNKDFAILRFHAGPPYEDIAFKIVNREWEYSYKRGFRCQFHNNIFQLWFHFKRYRYRR